MPYELPSVLFPLQIGPPLSPCALAAGTQGAMGAPLLLGGLPSSSLCRPRSWARLEAARSRPS
jgi:hypothetical protein